MRFAFGARVILDRQFGHPPAPFLAGNARHYYQFTSTQAATPGLDLEFSQVSSSTGPVAFQLGYSTDGTDFINVPGGAYTVSNSVSF
jgi:hypothetical protein